MNNTCTLEFRLGLLGLYMPMISVIRGRDTVMKTSSNFEQLAKGDVHNSQLYTKCVKTNNYITLYSIYSVVVLNTAIIMIGKDSTGARF